MAIYLGALSERTRIVKQPRLASLLRRQGFAWQHNALGQIIMLTPTHVIPWIQKRFRNRQLIHGELPQGDLLYAITGGIGIQ